MATCLLIKLHSVKRYRFNYLFTTAYVRPTIKDNLIVPIHNRTIVVSFEIILLICTFFYWNLHVCDTRCLYLFFFDSLFVSICLLSRLFLGYINVRIARWLIRTKVNNRNYYFFSHDKFALSIFEIKNKTK